MGYNKQPETISAVVPDQEVECQTELKVQAGKTRFFKVNICFQDPFDDAMRIMRTKWSDPASESLRPPAAVRSF
jgi:hypothetical protein